MSPILLLHHRVEHRNGDALSMERDLHVPKPTHASETQTLSLSRGGDLKGDSSSVWGEAVALDVAHGGGVEPYEYRARHIINVSTGYCRPVTQRCRLLVLLECVVCTHYVYVTNQQYKIPLRWLIEFHISTLIKIWHNAKNLHI